MAINQVYHGRDDIESEGCDAAQQGQKLSDCPYRVGTPEHSEWVQGWIDFAPYVAGDDAPYKAFQRRQAERRAAAPERPKLDPDIAALMEPEATLTWQDVVITKPDPVEKILAQEHVDKVMGGIFQSAHWLSGYIPLTQQILADIHAAQVAQYQQRFFAASVVHLGVNWTWNHDPAAKILPKPEPDDPLRHPKRPLRGGGLIRKPTIRGIVHDPWAHQKLVAMKQEPSKPPTFKQFMRNYLP